MNLNSSCRRDAKINSLLATRIKVQNSRRLEIILTDIFNRSGFSCEESFIKQDCDRCITRIESQKEERETKLSTEEKFSGSLEVEPDEIKANSEVSEDRTPRMTRETKNETNKSCVMESTPQISYYDSHRSRRVKNMTRISDQQSNFICKNLRVELDRLTVSNEKLESFSINVDPPAPRKYGKRRMSFVQQDESVTKISRKDTNNDVSKNNLILENISIKNTKLENKKTVKLYDWSVNVNREKVLLEGYKLNDVTPKLWQSSKIEERIKQKLVRSSTGTMYSLIGKLDKVETINNGISMQVCSKFLNGFPLNWKNLLLTESIKSSVVKYKKLNFKADLVNLEKSVDEIDVDSLPRTRSGRVVFPRLKHWENQYTKSRLNNSICLVGGVVEREIKSILSTDRIVPIPKKTVAKGVQSTRKKESKITMEKNDTNNLNLNEIENEKKVAKSTAKPRNVQTQKKEIQPKKGNESTQQLNAKTLMKNKKIDVPSSHKLNEQTGRSVKEKYDLASLKSRHDEVYNGPATRTRSRCNVKTNPLPLKIRSPKISKNIKSQKKNKDLNKSLSVTKSKPVRIVPETNLIDKTTKVPEKVTKLKETEEKKSLKTAEIKLTKSSMAEVKPTKSSSTAENKQTNSTSSTKQKSTSIAQTKPKPKATKKTGKDKKVVEKTKPIPVISARPGTITHHRQVLEAISHQNENYEADLFTASAYKIGKMIKIPIKTSVSDLDNLSDCSANITPKIRIPVPSPASRHRTPEPESPFSKPFPDELFRRKEVDSYIHNRRKKGQGPQVHKRFREKAGETKRKSVKKDTSKLANIISKLNYSTDNDNFEDENDDKDFYFDDED